MNKHALLVAFHFPPQAASSGIQRTLSFSRHLGNHGWDPLILSANPIAYSVKNSSQLAMLPPDLVVKRAFALDTKRHLGIFGHYPEMLALPDRWISWWLAAVPAGLSLIRQYKPQVIWSTFPIASAPLIALTLHRITGLPWIADFRDPMLQDEYPSTKFQRKAYRWIEQRAIHQCKKAVFTTHSAMDSYKRRFPEVLHEKFAVIENGYDEEIFRAATSDPRSDSPKADAPLTLLHSGVLYADGRDPSAFFEAIASLKAQGRVNASGLRVVLRATGDDSYFNALVKKYGIDDIASIEASVPYRDALKEMLNVDGLLLFQGKLFNTQIPAKIYEYFRARKPILGLLDSAGETARVIGEAGFQDIAPMDSAAAIIPALERFIARIQKGNAHVASEAVIAASSRTHRAAELAQIFHCATGALLMRNAGRTSVFKGALLTVSMRWTDRLIGFASTLILARLLVPADFGVVAMASLVVGLVDVLLSLGVNVALIRNHDATPAHYNTAWTLRLAQSALAAATVFAVAPAAALYFSDPRIIPVLRFMSLSMLLVGMENIGIITFQKEMRFGLDFRFVFLKRIVGFLSTILAAWLLRSYWALVIGTFAGRSFGVLLSYRMHPMRPCFSLEKLKEIFSVSQWMLLNSIAGYVNLNLDKILIGRRANATIVGGYTLADEIAAMPSTEVLAPINRVLFPTFVSAKNDLAELKRLYLLAQGVQSLLGISAGVGLVLVAHDAVLVLLGEKWLFVVPFVQVLALANVVEAITTSGRYVLLTMGKIRSAALVNWLQVILFATGALLLLPDGNALQLASIRVVTVLVEFLVSIWLLMQTLNNVGVSDIIGTVLRPLLATGGMALAVTFVGQIIQLGPLAELIVKIATGIASFPAAILLMWWFAGKPPGAESYLLYKALSVLVYRKT